ncbi:MAG: DUF2147 domain-containing protein [Bacteroidales bacterium]|nr:DUF2147 domain-containing protein [Bacteroidales bacterium]
MRKIVISLIICLYGLTIFAQNPDAICGIYYMVDPFSKEGSQVEIFKASNGDYEGKVVWVENPKKKKFLGLVFMTTLQYNAEKKEYQNGTLKYPGKPGTFSTFMSIVDNKKLKVRGYWGVAALGKTMYWYREDKVRVQKD